MGFTDGRECESASLGIHAPLSSAAPESLRVPVAFFPKGLHPRRLAAKTGVAAPYTPIDAWPLACCPLARVVARLGSNGLRGDVRARSSARRVSKGRGPCATHPKERPGGRGPLAEPHDEPDVGERTSRRGDARRGGEGGTPREGDPASLSGRDQPSKTQEPNDFRRFREIEKKRGPLSMAPILDRPLGEGASRT